MPISNYDGNTFVAFLDISGFRELMGDERKAWKALDRLYEYGYEILSGQGDERRVDGIFVSDSGVLFVRRNNQIPRTSDDLVSLLIVLRRINKRMLDNGFMLTTSIAYGRFRYQERIEFRGIGKNAVYGNAYVSAFFDNENGKPRIQPGQCRMIERDLPSQTKNRIAQTQSDNIFGMIKKREGDSKHYYYYWMVDHCNEIEGFEQEYKDTYSLKYAGMLKALKGEGHQRYMQ